MKALSVRQPWASLIVLGAKRIENRSWCAPPSIIGQRIAIHASAGKLAFASWSEIVDGPEIPLADGVWVDGQFLPPLRQLPRGVLLGTVEIAGCSRFIDLPDSLREDPFASPGCYCWLLCDPKPSPAPIPCRGALRLWTLAQPI